MPPPPCTRRHILCHARSQRAARATLAGWAHLGPASRLDALAKDNCDERAEGEGQLTRACAREARRGRRDREEWERAGGCSAVPSLVQVRYGRVRGTGCAREPLCPLTRAQGPGRPAVCCEEGLRIIPSLNGFMPRPSSLLPPSPVRTINSLSSRSAFDFSTSMSRCASCTFSSWPSSDQGNKGCGRGVSGTSSRRAARPPPLDGGYVELDLNAKGRLLSSGAVQGVK
eukprot:scaffold21122_cov107-Isochrysis_galbana.AAC.1